MIHRRALYTLMIAAFFGVRPSAIATVAQPVVKFVRPPDFFTIDTSGPEPVYRNRSGLILSEWSFGAPINLDLDLDLDGDGVVNDADALRFMSGQHVNLSGMTAEEAFALGDLNGDFRNDYEDLRIFADAFDVNNGAGAFAAALAVPEPMTVSLCLVGIVACLNRRRQPARDRRSLR